MKVKCVRIIKPIDKSQVTKDHWLTIGKEYSVLSVVGLSGLHIQFRIISDDGGTPILVDSKQFETTSTDIPERWIVKLSENGWIEFAPEKWTRDDFWMDFYDGKEDARVDFFRECDKMGLGEEIL